MRCPAELDGFEFWVGGLERVHRWGGGLLAVWGLALLLSGCGDGRLLSRREVADRLERKYGEEFTVTSSKGVDEHPDDIWWARRYTAVSKEHPEREFFVFDIVTGESGGILGFVNGLVDTYALDVFFEAFQGYAEEAGVEFEFDYDRDPYAVSAEYYSGLGIVMDPVGPENLGVVCRVLADACADTLKAIPGAAGENVNVRVLLRYREEGWEEKDCCAWRMSLFSDYAVEAERFTDAGALEENVLAEVRQYLERKGDG